MSACDALVVGGGPAGSTAATLLARAGWNVVLAEKAVFPRRKVCGEYISGAAWPLLEALGVASRIASRAGPEITAVGLFANDARLVAPMPVADIGPGRALGREHLDALLLERAASAGAQVRERTAVTRIGRTAEGHECRLEGDAQEAVVARIVVAAHGSWEPGELPTHAGRTHASPSHLLGFKAHFREAALAPGLMPLVLFPGGYGGMVHTDAGRVSLSCCVRRGALARIRASHPGLRAGEALFAHIVETSRGVRDALAGAAIDGPWLAAGPVCPGIRRFRRAGVFAVGNAAGEAHPIVAEGISMAIQSSFLLCESLLRAGSGASQGALDAVARDYEKAWRANFAMRVHAAAFLARFTGHRLGRSATVELLRRMPALLTRGARWSGKDRRLRGAVALGGAR